MKICLKSLNRDKNKIIYLLTLRESSLLLFICVLAILEVILHISVFTYLLTISGISSIVLALIFGTICGYTSSGIWIRHDWTLIPYLYAKWFKNNSILMKYSIK